MDRRTPPLVDGAACLSRSRCNEPSCLRCASTRNACRPTDVNPAPAEHDQRRASTVVVVAKRLAPTDDDRREMCRVALGAVASGVPDDFTTDWRTLADKRFPFPADVFTELAADAMGLAGVTRSEPVSLDDFAERYLPEYEFRGNTAHQKMRAALNLVVGVHGGVMGDYFGVAGWWQLQDLSWFAFVTLVLMVRVAAERTGRPVADVCSELAAARGVVV